MAQTYALFQALMAGDWEVAKVLLEQRQPWQGRRPADPLARFHYGQTTLIAAAQGGCVEAVAPLVAAGVPVDAALDRNTPASKPLQSHIKRNYTDHELLHMYCLADGMTALHVAADRGDDRMVAALLAAGASVDRRDFRRRAPLSQVVEGAVADATASRVECARLLMEAGADPLGQLSADERASALGYACWIGGRRGALGPALLRHLIAEHSAGRRQLNCGQLLDCIHATIAACQHEAFNYCMAEAARRAAT